jgi:hypothetical protein
MTNLQIAVDIFINTKHKQRDCHFLHVFVYGEQDLANI